MEKWPVPQGSMTEESVVIERLLSETIGGGWKAGTDVKPYLT